MTFTQIKAAIKDYCLLTSAEADTRVGTAINRHYRRITSQLGMEATRFVSRTAITTVGIQTVTVADLEKIDRVLDISAPAAPRVLADVTLHTLRTTPAGTGSPLRWALQNTAAASVTILLDTVPSLPYALQADGWTTLADLSGSDEPVFPESFHDVLVWFVISEELLKKEKLQLAGTYEQKAERLLADLRFHLADSHTRDLRQASGPGTVGMGTGGGPGGGLGGSSYTQTGLLTFDRDPDPPFAVTDGSASVPNLGAEFLGPIATDRLVGRDTAGIGDSEQLTVGGGLEFTGSGGIQIAAGGVTYAQVQDVSAASRLLGRGSAAGAGSVEEITVGTGLLLSDTTLTATGVLAGHHTTHDTGGSDALTALSADLLTSGTLSDARLSGNVALENVANVFTQDQTISATRPSLVLGTNAKARLIQPLDHYCAVTANLVFDGSAWQADDTTKSGLIFLTNPTTFVWYYSPAGPNPRIPQETGYLDAMGFRSALDLYEKGRTTPMGHWIDVPYSAGNFSGSGGMTWTVEAGDILANRYTLIGKTLLWHLRIGASSVGGTPHYYLQVNIPAGLTVVDVLPQFVVANDGAGIVSVYTVVISGGAMAFAKVASATWPVSTNATSIDATIIAALA